MYQPLGCHSARNMLDICERRCPNCGAVLEIFIREGKLAAEARCEQCGHVDPVGTPVEDWDAAG